MPKTYTCPNHQRTLTSYCPDCCEAFANRRDPDTMTGDERAAELRWWGDILTIPFSDLHQRYEELVGRGIFTHEFAGEAAVELLIEEARTREHPTPGEILNKIPAHKRIIVELD
jgi:hypothetical protein